MFECRRHLGIKTEFVRHSLITSKMDWNSSNLRLVLSILLSLIHLMTFGVEATNDESIVFPMLMPDVQPTQVCLQTILFLFRK